MIAVATLGLTAATMAQNVPNYIPTNGLVGWWPFNGNANDESGNNNNGTVNGATLTSDRFGNANKAYSFDGLNDFISYTQTPISNIDSVTLSFWLSPKSLNQFSTAVCLGYDAGNTGNNGVQVGISGLMQNPTTCTNVLGNKISFIRSGLGCGSINAVLNDTTSWHFVVMSRKNGTTKYYYDGVLVNSNNSVINSIINSFRVGSSIGLRYCKNVLDDIGIWNRPLTQQEITDLYNANICYQIVTVTDTLIINTNLVGFNPITYQNTIKIFPNPTSDHITINYGNFATLNGYQLKIINSLGQQMFQTAINQQSSYINLSNWTGNGIYFVQIIDPQGNIIDIRKIVLQ